MELETTIKEILDKNNIQPIEIKRDKPESTFGIITIERNKYKIEQVVEVLVKSLPTLNCRINSPRTIIYNLKQKI